MNPTDLGALAIVISVVALIVGVLRAEYYRQRGDHWMAEYTRATSDCGRRRPAASVYCEGETAFVDVDAIPVAPEVTS